jgi:preprotein translocase subunit SecD
MSKVKSAIITALLVAAIIVAAFFATISYPIGTTQRYNSIASSINLGADYSGNAYATLYPEDVISAQDYNFLEDKTEYVRAGSVYYKNTVDKDALTAQVASDAAILNQRFSEKGYSSYSVSVQDGISIKVSVPTNFSYAAYTNNNSTTRSSQLTIATTAISYLTVGGGISLRTVDRSITTDDDTPATFNGRVDEYTDTALVDDAKTYPLTKVTEDVNSFFTSVTSWMSGATPVISLNLTEFGQERIKEISTFVASSDSQILYIFMGETLMMSITIDETLNQNKIQLQADTKEVAENIAIALNSAVNGNALQVTYSEIEEVVTSTALAGDNAALFAFIASLVILAVAVVLLIVRYKKLGIVASLMAIVFSLVIVYALYILEIQLTFAGILTAAAGLSLLLVSNIIVFEEVRKQTSVGKTMSAAIKTAYKNTMMTIADIHIVLLAAAILLTTVAVGEAAACGFIMVVATIASYILYWFTRYMWYVLSSPVKDRDKYKFGGFKRVAYDD